MNTHLHHSLQNVIKKKFKQNVPLREIYNIKSCGSTGFVLQKKLGEGAYGVIYSALCSKQKGYVVKVQEENAILEAVYTRIFSYDGLAPKVYQVHINPKYKATVIIMESMDRTVEDVLVDNKKNASKICDIIENTYKTMDKLHKSGFIHGDAHIGNFMTKGKQIKLIDFGFSIEIHYLIETLMKNKKKYNKLYKSVIDALDGLPQLLDVLKLMLNFADFIYDDISEKNRAVVVKCLVDCTKNSLYKLIVPKDRNKYNCLKIFEPILDALLNKRLSVAVKMIEKAYKKLYYTSCLELIYINEKRLEQFDHKEVFEALEKELKRK